MTRKTLQTFQCPHTRDCGNDQCFWRQRDAFGYQAVTSAFMTTQQLEMVQAKRDAIKDAYGDPYFPTLRVEVGTNCLYVVCDHFEEPR